MVGRNISGEEEARVERGRRVARWRSCSLGFESYNLLETRELVYTSAHQTR